MVDMRIMLGSASRSVTLTARGPSLIMDTVLELPVMTERERRTMPIRIDVAALEAAKIAAAYKGISVMEYASQILLDAAKRDIEEGHRTFKSGAPPKPRKPKGSD